MLSVLKYYAHFESVDAACKQKCEFFKHLFGKNEAERVTTSWDMTTRHLNLNKEMSNWSC